MPKRSRSQLPASQLSKPSARSTIPRGENPSSATQSLMPCGAKPTLYSSPPRHVATARYAVRGAEYGNAEVRNPGVEIAHSGVVRFVAGVVVIFALRRGLLVTKGLKGLFDALSDVFRQQGQMLGKRVLKPQRRDPDVRLVGIGVYAGGNYALTTFGQQIDDAGATDAEASRFRSALTPGKNQ